MDSILMFALLMLRFTMEAFECVGYCTVGLPALRWPSLLLVTKFNATSRNPGITYSNPLGIS